MRNFMYIFKYIPVVSLLFSILRKLYYKYRYKGMKAV